jgi:hypothetical protein
VDRKVYEGVKCVSSRMGACMALYLCDIGPLTVKLVVTVWPHVDVSSAKPLCL